MVTETNDAAPPPPADPARALDRLLAAAAEDAAFALACGGGASVFEDLGKRRETAYEAILAGHASNGLLAGSDPWRVELTRAMAPLHAPALLPMGDVIRERVTLEGGPRGLRSLFSSKASEKDVIRVRRLGTLGARVLRAVFAADGPLDAEENLDVAAFVASLGLPEDVTRSLETEEPVPVEQLDVYGDVDSSVARALVRGAWLAATSDGLDPREDLVVRVLANKLSIPAMDLEVVKNQVLEMLDARKLAGLATIDAVRFVLSDRAEEAATLAKGLVPILFARAHRDEALANVASGPTVTMAKRYRKLDDGLRRMALGVAWALAMRDDPSLTRRALLRARHDRVAEDVRDDGALGRAAVDGWLDAMLAPAAKAMTAPSTNETR